jgi:fructokinase
VALTLGRLAVPVAFVGGISTDFFGDALAQGLEENGVSLALATRLDRPTTLAFVTLEQGEARYAFYDADAADRYWRLDGMPAVPAEVKALQFGCISLLRHPAAEDYARLMEQEAGRRVISFDANIRPGLVRDERDYRERLDLFFRTAHIIKVSDADLDWIAPGQDPRKLADSWLRAEARLVLLTRGGQGATIFGRNGQVSRPAPAITVADTVGAGDSFMGGLLAALDDRGWLAPSRLETLSEPELAEILHFALAVAAVTCSRIGADPPRRAELARFLQKGG